MDVKMEQTSDIRSTGKIAHIATQQEKLDAIFGITGGKSVDEFLDSINVEDENSTTNALSSFNKNIQDKLQQMNKDELPSLDNMKFPEQLASLESSLTEIKELVDLSKDVVKHVAESILAVPLIDSEAVQAYSKLIESIHLNIAEFIGAYRDKMNFVNKVKFSMLAQEQKKELIKYKHDLAIELLNKKQTSGAIDADEAGSSTWNQEDITKILAKKNIYIEGNKQ